MSDAAGYYGIGNSATYVYARWTIPQTQSCPSSGQTAAAFAVELTGNTAAYAEQVGTVSGCDNGNPFYFAYIDGPGTTVTYYAIPHVGDLIEAHITYSTSSHNSVYYLKDLTTGTVATKTVNYYNPYLYNAAWVVLSGCVGGCSSGPDPLTNFGSVHFTYALGTVNGASQYVNNMADVWKVSMVVSPYTLAYPSNLGSSGSFTIYWNHA